MRCRVVIAHEIGVEAEIVETAGRESMYMGRVRVEVEAAEVRNSYPHPPSCFRYAVQLLHHPYHVIQMLNNVLAHYRAERAVLERVGEDIEVPHNVRVDTRVY